MKKLLQRIAVALEAIAPNPVQLPTVTANFQGVGGATVTMNLFWPFQGDQYTYSATVCPEDGEYEQARVVRVIREEDEMVCRIEVQRNTTYKYYVTAQVGDRFKQVVGQLETIPKNGSEA